MQNALLECFDIDRSSESEREGKILCRTCSYILELNNASGRELLSRHCLILELMLYHMATADGWPELDSTLRNLLSSQASIGRQRLFYAFITEYPIVVADMSISDLRHGLRHGLGGMEKEPSLVAEALKACVAVLSFDDRFAEFKDLIPEMLNVRTLIPV